MTALTRVCATEGETRRLACALGATLREPVILLLEGDLGSGKTCFAQGIALGLGVDPALPVTSPTFTLVNEYLGRLPFIHADLYRLEGESLDDIGLADILDRPAVVAVEWPDRMAYPADLDHINVRIEVLEDDARRIRLEAYGLGPAKVLREVDLHRKEPSCP